MENRVKICCVVLNYNDSETVEEYVNSIYDYECIGDIIIVDNCSTDLSYERLKKLTNNKIHLIKTEKNGGYGYGNNIGIEYAKKLDYKYAIISNPDVYVSKETVDICLNCILHYSNCAILSPIQKNNEGRVISDFAWHLPSALQYACSGTRLERVFKNKYILSEMTEKETYIVDCLPGAFLIINIDHFINCGGYDERVFLFCEETIIGKKMHDAGYETRIMPAFNYIHKGSSSVDKGDIKNRKNKMILENRLFYIDNYIEINKFKKIIARWILLYRIKKLQQ